MIVGAALALPASVAVAESSAHLEVQARSALQLPANATRGKVLYMHKCASCHGADAQGDVTRLVPSLAGQRRGYLVKHMAQLNDVEQAAGSMHPEVDRASLNASQAWVDLAAFLNGCPPLPVLPSSNDVLAQRGARSYQRWCASCHAADARGDDARFAPGLRHQHHAYLLKQLQMTAALHRMSIRAEVLNVFDSLSAQQTAGIADHISRIKDLRQAGRPASIDKSGTRAVARVP